MVKRKQTTSPKKSAKQNGITKNPIGLLDDEPMQDIEVLTGLEECEIGKVYKVRCIEKGKVEVLGEIFEEKKTTDKKHSKKDGVDSCVGDRKRKSEDDGGVVAKVSKEFQAPGTVIEGVNFLKFTY